MKYDKIDIRSLLIKITQLFLTINLVAVMLYSLLWLKLFDNSETKIQDNVVLRFDSPTEYQNNNAFWWMLKGSNRLRIVNFAPETHRGTIKLVFENNPCDNVLNLSIGKTYFKILPKQMIEVKHEFEVNPLETISLKLEVNQSDNCILKNGDTRNFGPKIKSWVIN